jgi:putative transcriptional regulator
MMIKPGYLLIASPELLTDHIFSKSVLLLVENNKTETMGFIVNQPLPLRLDDVFEDIPLNIQIWNGGPVETENLFYIHNNPNILDAVLFDIENGLYIGGNFQQVKELLLQTVLDETNIKFFLGYAGWGGGQLKAEISEKAWFVAHNNINLFNLDPKDLWSHKIIEVDPKNIIWKNAPSNPYLN